MEEQLPTRQKLGIGFCPFAGSGKPLVVALEWLGGKAGRRSKCGVAGALCLHTVLDILCGHCLRDFFNMCIYGIF